jgi:hypothetical protein
MRLHDCNREGGALKAHMRQAARRAKEEEKKK